MCLCRWNKYNSESNESCLPPSSALGYLTIGWRGGWFGDGLNHTVLYWAWYLLESASIRKFTKFGNFRQWFTVVYQYCGLSMWLVILTTTHRNFTGCNLKLSFHGHNCYSGPHLHSRTVGFPGYKYYYQESKSACKKSMECTPNNFQVLVKLNLYFSKFPLTMQLFRHTQKKNLTPTSRLQVWSLWLRKTANLQMKDSG